MKKTQTKEIQMMNELVNLCNTNENLGTRYHWYEENSVMYFLGFGLKGSFTFNEKTLEYELVLNNKVLAKDQIEESDDIAYSCMKAIRKEI